MNVTVENILNHIKKIEPKDFYKKLVVLYTKIDLYKGFNEKIRWLHEIVNEIANQKEPNPAVLFKEEANLKKFKRMIVLRKVIISQYLKSLAINENELKANISEVKMEDETTSYGSSTIFSTSTDVQSSNSESLKPLTEKLNYLKKNTKNYLPNVLLAYEKLYEHYGLAYEDHKKKQSPETLDEEEVEDIKYLADLVEGLPKYEKEKFDSFMLDWFQKFY
uniref:Uncharacterized protein n=1 Tax=Meloidogyne enterolobii TaxID=390850 RepID=A0A6V7UEN5_MELEN|nr:unnamed protein product [Meloidogyne enterolobii]